MLGLVECENGHIFCPEHSKDQVEIFRQIEESNNDDYGQLYISPSLCPICKMEVVTNQDAAAYLIKNQDMDYIKEEIKGRFKSYEDFQKYLEMEDYNEN
jgi:hypothetical protein